MTTAPDRSTELYEGQAGTVSEQRLVAARVHWMASQACGSDVLDIGCGQGITALLLARAGHAVIGIDSDPEVIRWARRRLRAEPEAVRKRLTFDVAEAGQLPFDDGRFDTLVLGGVLEQQSDLSQPLAEALRVLRRGGRLVITSLYSELRGPPVGEPLYLTGLIALLAARGVAVDDVAQLGRYMAVSASSTGGGAVEPTAAVWMAALDGAERRLATLNEESLATGAELAAAADRQQALERQLVEQRHSARPASAQLMHARERLVAAETERDGVRREADRAADALALAADRIGQLQAELGEGSVRLGSVETEVSMLRGAIEYASRKIAELEAGSDALQTNLAVARDAAQATRVELGVVREQSESAHDEVRGLTATVERLKAKLSAREGQLAKRRAPSASRRDAPAVGVLHLIARSLPHNSSPIALDRHGLVRAQRKLGLDASVATDLDFPRVLGIEDSPSCELVDAVAYYRLFDPSGQRRSDRLDVAIHVAEPLLRVIDPGVLHAASIEMAPLAIELARRNKLRCVIELAHEQKSPPDFDIGTLADADAVIAICDEQQRWALTVGVPESRVQVIPPFVDVSRFAGDGRRGVNGREPVVGVMAYEPDSPAVECLRTAIDGSASAASGLVAYVKPPADTVSRTAGKLSLSAGVVTEQEVAPAQISATLALMDVVIAATPHEALGAMAAGRAVIGVGAALSLVPGVEQLAELVRDRRLRTARAAAASERIESQHTTAAVKAYARVYGVPEPA